MKRSYSLIALTLTISLFIYLFYRTERTVVNELVIFILSFDTYAAIRGSITNAIPLNGPAIFSLPGGLWVFCTTILSKDYYMKIRNHKMRIVVVPIVFAVGLELLQLIHFTNGMFDFWDVGFYIMFWFLGYYSFHSQRSQQNILSPFTLSSFICLTCFLAVYLAHVRQ
ncbi:hypothetical protein [Cesiribacter sp. SM1]|uniref:hypothetical protein n=1 Tax=Cesiribacter sp. SM1 TaxID=2861196 RepID=UPI001CD67123|nr:hypothetical protein [Cesiribacter sp. SM1]